MVFKKSFKICKSMYVCNTFNTNYSFERLKDCKPKCVHNSFKVQQWDLELELVYEEEHVVREETEPSPSEYVVHRDKKWLPSFFLSLFLPRPLSLLFLSSPQHKKGWAKGILESLSNGAKANRDETLCCIRSSHVPQRCGRGCKERWEMGWEGEVNRAGSSVFCGQAVP